MKIHNGMCEKLQIEECGLSVCISVSFYISFIMLTLYSAFDFGLVIGRKFELSEENTASAARAEE
jgi:hypothetical protein